MQEKIKSQPAFLSSLRIQFCVCLCLQSMGRGVGLCSAADLLFNLCVQIFFKKYIFSPESPQTVYFLIVCCQVEVWVGVLNYQNNRLTLKKFLSPAFKVLVFKTQCQQPKVHQGFIYSKIKKNTKGFCTIGFDSKYRFSINSRWQCNPSIS